MTRAATIRKHNDASDRARLTLAELGSLFSTILVSGTNQSQHRGLCLSLQQSPARALRPQYG